MSVRLKGRCPNQNVAPSAREGEQACSVRRKSSICKVPRNQVSNQHTLCGSRACQQIGMQSAKAQLQQRYRLRESAAERKKRRQLQQKQQRRRQHTSARFVLIVSANVLMLPRWLPTSPSALAAASAYPCRAAFRSSGGGETRSLVLCLQRFAMLCVNAAVSRVSGALRLLFKDFGSEVLCGTAVQQLSYSRSL